MKPSILFVDDEPNLLSGLRRLMRPYADRWDMAFLPSAREALTHIDRTLVHLIVSDMRMPGMDGAELLETVSERTPGIIRFALSGETDANQAIRIAGRSHRFLAKPIDPQALIKSIDALFAQSGKLLDEHRRRNASVFDALKCAPGRLDALGKLLAEPDVDSVAVNALIMSDPSLSIRVLQLANSAYFGKPLKTIMLPRAINYIGLARLGQLVARERLGTEFSSAPHVVDDHLVRIMAAVMAREQANATGRSGEIQDLAYATALFSGLGAHVEDDGKTCASAPGCMAALFGLPSVLVDSLTRFERIAEGARTEVEIAAFALEASGAALEEAKEAA